jgi:hypothetical protein
MPPSGITSRQFFPRTFILRTLTTAPAVFCVGKPAAEDTARKFFAA